MSYELNEKRSPTYLLPIAAVDASPIPEKREPSYVVFIDANGDPIDLGGGGSGSVTAADISDATTVGRNVLKAADAAAARTAIGAGTPYTLPAATTAVAGGIKKAVAQADSVATDAAGLVTDFNTLLAKLRTAGILS
ncbi:Head fiber protein [compost metagenome]